MGLTRDLSTIIHGVRYDDLGDECIHRVKQAIKDGIAVALAGHREAPVVIASEHLLSLGGSPQATVWGKGVKVSMTQAAYINAVATHVLDFEPMWSPPTHAVSPTVPVAFALAEARDLPGKDIIAAVAKGLEIQGRLQFAGDQYVPDRLKFHPPGVAGVLGSAVVAADLLRLNVERLQHALGLASSRAGALLANIGSMAKCTHCGNAAASGLDAALLAQRGFTANPDILEAPRGLIATYYSDTFDPQKLLDYGKPYRVVAPGLAIKLFPSQYGTHWAISAGLELHSRITDAAQIRHVRMRSPVMKYIDRPQPVNGLDGKFSLQYTAAAALLDGSVRIDTFSDERRFRADMIDLLGKIALTQDASIAGDFHDMRVELDVEFTDGRRIATVCRGPKGCWGVALADADHRLKLEDCLRRALPDARSAELIALLDDLERHDAAGVRRIISLLAGEDREPASNPSRPRR